MKEKDKIEGFLNELAQATRESIRTDFADDIKRHIPEKLTAHRSGIDTVSIIIDLRVSRSVAAAAIILTMVLLAGFFSRLDSAGGDIYQDSKMLLNHFLGKAEFDRGNLIAAKAKYDYLTKHGRDVIYYGDIVDPRDVNSLLMQWRLPDGSYSVVFGDLHEENVSADQLVELQARMLKARMR